MKKYILTIIISQLVLLSSFMTIFISGYPLSREEERKYYWASKRRIHQDSRKLEEKEQYLI